jgi:predicted hotdog family 3-hydroxylacyl-ACP dehydratase
MNKAEICARIPHSGSMCLLERVDRWDDTHIHCSASSHRDATNPLRSHQQLHAVCGVEYAAQAMAVHANLLNTDERAQPSMGFLASVRDLRLAVQRLDDVPDELHIHASRLSGGEDSFIYEFEIEARARLLMSGRVAVKLFGPAR